MREIGPGIEASRAEASRVGSTRVEASRVGGTKSRAWMVAVRVPAWVGAFAGVFAMGSCGGDAGGNADDVDVPLVAVIEDVFTVGTFSGEDWETFGSIAEVGFDAEGNLHILDRQSHRVVVVDRLGQWVRNVGSQGEGPGELGRPAALVVMADGRAVVFDAGMPGAFEVFDAEGRFLSGVRAEALMLPGGDLSALGDDRLVSTNAVFLDMMAGLDMAAGLGGDGTVDVFSLAGEPPDVFHRAWVPPPPEQSSRTEEFGVGEMTMQIPVPPYRAFEPELHMAVTRGGQILLADSIGYAIKRIGADGSVKGVVARSIAPERVTDAIRGAARQDALEQAEAEPEGFDASELRAALGDGFLEQARNFMLASIETMTFADEIPVIADLEVDGAGRIWVQRTVPGGVGESPGPIDVLDSDGSYIGTFAPDDPAMPDAFGPDGMMAYIETGELDVPVVRVVRIAELRPR